MKRVLVRGERRVAAVGGEGVLGEVVRADAEEVGLLGKRAGAERGGGNLDHDAGRDGPFVDDAPFFQLIVGPRERFPGAEKIGRVGDHREHDAEIAAVRGAEDGAQLDAE